MPEQFNFYENTLAISFQNPKGKKDIKADFAMEGNSDFLTNGLIEQMERHPELAVILTNAAFNYMQRNGKPKNEQ